MDYTLGQISEIVSGKLRGHAATRISKLFIDSRSFVYDKQSLFVAIKGERNDGHRYIGGLYNKGITNFIVEQVPNATPGLKDANFILVKDSLKALQQIAAHHRKQYTYPIIGITGSNGKTIVKEWLFQLLGSEKRIIRNPKSYNSQVGVPLSVLLLEKNYDFGIFEGGISQTGEMCKLEKIIRPDIGIFTNIGDAHQENFIDSEQKIKEKLQLFNNSNLLIYCKDHQELDQRITQKANAKKIKFFTWSVSAKADLTITKIKQSKNESSISFLFQEKTDKINIPFTDPASIENAIHVLAFLLSQDLYNKNTKDGFKQLQAVAMRLEIMPGTNNCTIINDSYNSDLNSIQIALDVLKRQQQHKKKSLIISDILQSGQNEKELYTKLAKIIEKADLNHIVLVGGRLKANAEIIKGKKSIFSDTGELLHSPIIKSFNEEAILIKGARKFRFDKISEALQQKTHRTVLEISMEALAHNLNFYRSKLKQATKIMAMVKAFSYGSGSYEIAAFLAHNRVDYLGVAYADEGVELRKSGINLPIMVMSPNFESFHSLISYNLEPELYSFTSLEQFNEIARQSTTNPWPVHLKIDTGMKRLGFEAHEIPQLIESLKKLKSIKVRSVFSHLVASDEAIHDKFTIKQIKDFVGISQQIGKILPYSFMRHIVNSSGIERFPDAHFDMVRLGIGLYGISPQNQSALVNIGALKTKISQIKTLKAGETVGYSRAGKSSQETRIAILPIGYADGLNRKLSNGNGSVFIKGKFAPYIGNICMDMSMIDLSDIVAKEGDEVVIFGKEVPITQLAKQTGTIPYEILAGISGRVKRVYLH